MDKVKISLPYRNSLTEILGLTRPVKKKLREDYFRKKPKPTSARVQITQELPNKKPVIRRRQSLVQSNFEDILTIKSKPLIDTWEKFPQTRLSSLVKFSSTEETYKKLQASHPPKSIQSKATIDLPLIKLEGW